MNDGRPVSPTPKDPDDDGRVSIDAHQLIHELVKARERVIRGKPLRLMLELDAREIQVRAADARAPLAARIDEAIASLAAGDALSIRTTNPGAGRLDIALSGGPEGAVSARLELPLFAAVPSAVGRPGQGKNLLVVDDDHDTVLLMTRVLQRSGYRVHPAFSVKSALASAREHAFELLVSDIGLPDGSGLDLLAQLRAAFPASKFRAIALTGFDSDVARIRDAGFDEHLTKPINMPTLEEAILKLLQPTDEHLSGSDRSLLCP